MIGKVFCFMGFHAHAHKTEVHTGNIAHPVVEWRCSRCGRLVQQFL